MHVISTGLVTLGIVLALIGLKFETLGLMFETLQALSTLIGLTVRGTVLAIIGPRLTGRWDWICTHELTEVHTYFKLVVRVGSYQLLMNSYIGQPISIAYK